MIDAGAAVEIGGRAYDDATIFGFTEACLPGRRHPCSSGWIRTIRTCSDLALHAVYDSDANCPSPNFDAENRLTAVDNGTTASYIYSAEGERVHENVGGVVEEFLNASGPQSLTLVDANQKPVETDTNWPVEGFHDRWRNSADEWRAAFPPGKAAYICPENGPTALCKPPCGEFPNYVNAIRGSTYLRSSRRPEGCGRQQQRGGQPPFMLVPFSSLRGYYLQPGSRMAPMRVV